MVKQESGATPSKKEQLWRERLTRFALSGLQVAEFCSNEAVSEASFYRWRKQLTELAATPLHVARFIDAGAMSAVAAPKLSAVVQETSAAPNLEVRLDLGHGLVLHIVRR